MAERLEFGVDGAPYHAMTVAEHVSRYYLARQLCAGRRVLDIACGEGYGSALMSAWGAREVVGVDIAPTAIGKARELFSTSNVSFLVGDACDMPAEFLGAEKFDLICCFETIEHVDDVDGLLNTLGSVRAPGGAVMISCPNDRLLPEGITNPFHKQVYSLEDVRRRTEAALGSAARWFLGTPMQGYGVVPSVGSFCTSLLDSAAVMQGQESGDLLLLPQHVDIAASAENADFYLGVWHEAAAAAVAVASLVSQSAFTAPWRELAALRQELLEREGKLAEAHANLAQTKAELAQAMTELERHRANLREALAHLERRTADLRRAEIVLAEERRSNAMYRARTDVDQHETRLSERQISAIAEEVWWERNRRTLGYKLSQAVRRLVAR